jgi:LPXTG-motif cell wall-anchored protein
MKMRIIAAAVALLCLSMAVPAYAEGETIEVVSKTCDQIVIKGSGYTPGQTVIAFARAPKGEGTITDQKTIIVDGAGNVGETALVFGGQVPDGTYEAVITTPGPGQKEEVTARFTMKDCGPGSPSPTTTTPDGSALPFTGPSHAMPTLTVGLVLLLAGGLLLRRSRTQ